MLDSMVRCNWRSSATELPVSSSAVLPVMRKSLRSLIDHVALPFRLSLTLSVILLASKSAADGPPGLQPRDPMLVQEILESGL
jgi:hypothetical protein